MILLLVMWSIAFIVFFTAIGMRFLSIIPIFVLLLFFLNLQDTGGASSINRDEVKTFFMRHALSFAWACVMLGMRGIADIFAYSSVYTALGLVGVNVLFWITSYAIEYADGKQMFHIGYYVAGSMLLGSIWWLVDLQAFIELTMAWISVTMAIYAFIVFIGGALQRKVHHSLSYPLFVLFTMSLMFLMYHYTADDLMLTFVLSQVILMALYCCIWGVYRLEGSHHDIYLEDDDETLKAILSGKMMHSVQSKPVQFGNWELVNDAYAFLSRLDPRAQAVIAFFNVLLIGGQVAMFLLHIGEGAFLRNEILLWYGIIVFFVNYLLLKQIGFAHAIQRVIAFGLINFGIYLTIINIFGNDALYLVGIGVVRSLLSSILMFHTQWLANRGYLQSRDYLYWIGANILISLCNLYFMFLLPVSLQLRFFVALMYVGLQLFLTMYNLKRLVHT